MLPDRNFVVGSQLKLILSVINGAQVTPKNSQRRLFITVIQPT